MASWGSAFFTALKIVIMSIIWAIIGGIFIVAGFSMMGSAIVPKIPATPLPPGGLPIIPEFDIGKIIAGGILALIGYSILLLGTLASFLKYSAEFYAEEVSKRRIIPPPPPQASGPYYYPPKT